MRSAVNGDRPDGTWRVGTRRSARFRSPRTVIRAGLPPFVAVVLAAMAWQLIAAHNPSAVPRLGAVWQSLRSEPGRYAANAAWTAEEMAVGLGAAAVVSFVLAVAMVEVRVVGRALMPLAVALNVTPVVSFAPGLVLLFGFTMVPRYVVTGVIVFFPFLVNAAAGLRAVDPEALDYLRTLDASRREILVHLRVPSALSYLFAAARICVPLSLVGAVVAEFTTSGNSRGLGSMIEIAYSQYGNLPVVYGAVAWLCAMGLVASGIVVVLERRYLRS